MWGLQAAPVSAARDGRGVPARCSHAPGFAAGPPRAAAAQAQLRGCGSSAWRCRRRAGAADPPPPAGSGPCGSACGSSASRTGRGVSHTVGWVGPECLASPPRSRLCCTRQHARRCMADAAATPPFQLQEGAEEEEDRAGGLCRAGCAAGQLDAGVGHVAAAAPAYQPSHRHALCLIATARCPAAAEPRLKYYDLEEGSGAAAQDGSRVIVSGASSARAGPTAGRRCKAQRQCVSAC